MKTILRNAIKFIHLHQIITIIFIAIITINQTVNIYFKYKNFVKIIFNIKKIKKCYKIFLFLLLNFIKNINLLEYTVTTPIKTIKTSAPKNKKIFINLKKNL